jgi:predicted  nucleic acid-binding Zn-ribbon protein
MSGAQKFYRLQLIDSQLEAIHTRLKEIGIVLSDDSDLKTAEQNVYEAANLLKVKQKDLREIENQVKDLQFKIAQNESALYGGRIQNPKELQDLQNESVSLKRYLAVLEDRQLEAMIIVEEAEEILQNLNQQVEKVHGNLIEQHAGLRSEQGQLLQDQQRLYVEHEATHSTFAPDELVLYQQLRKTRRGLAVAKISERTCSACGSTLTPAILQEASNSPSPVFCPTCGRILFAT